MPALWGGIEVNVLDVTRDAECSCGHILGVHEHVANNGWQCVVWGCDCRKFETTLPYGLRLTIEKIKEESKEQ